jgi:hypothetical protein
MIRAVTGGYGFLGSVLFGSISIVITGVLPFIAMLLHEDNRKKKNDLDPLEVKFSKLIEIQSRLSIQLEHLKESKNDEAPEIIESRRRLGEVTSTIDQLNHRLTGARERRRRLELEFEQEQEEQRVRREEENRREEEENRREYLIFHRVKIKLLTSYRDLYLIEKKKLEESLRKKLMSKRVRG